jgi:AraC-like DNA-binding protein
MMRRVRFARYPLPPGLDDLMAFGWSVEWDLPPGRHHAQDVLPFPSVNVSVGDAPPEGPDPGPGPFAVRAYVTGHTRTVTTRVLSGRGRTVALRSTIGGFGAWVDDVAALEDRVLDLDDLVPGATARALRMHALGPGEAVAGLSVLLAEALGDRPPDRVRAAREVASWARRAEEDPSIHTVARLASDVGVSSRTLQRMFARSAGVSPAWVLRRFRLLEAIERVRDGGRVSWAEVAADLGYSDQAHLTRDFTATIGITPSAYAAGQRPPAASPEEGGPVR